jgi:pilus assembly protein CpaB
MKRILLVGLAALFAVAAVVVGVMGYRMSTGQSTAGTDGKTVAATYQVVVAARDLAPGMVVQAGDLRVQGQPTLPVNTFSMPEQIVGRKLTVAARADQPVTIDMLETQRSIATKLNPGERAVAVQVDKIIGIGGFALPGDKVDVLLFLRKDDETGDITTAQVVLRDIRVVSFENNTGDAPPAASSKDEKDKNQRAQREERNPSAVLAVAEADVARLMLAASSGTLRLALRPDEDTMLTAEPAALPAGEPGATAPAATTAAAGAVAATAAAAQTAAKPAPGKKEDPVKLAAREAQLISLSELSFANTKPVAKPGAAKPKVVVTNKVEIYEGEKAKTVTPPSR